MPSTDPDINRTKKFLETFEFGYTPPPPSLEKFQTETDSFFRIASLTRSLAAAKKNKSKFAWVMQNFAYQIIHFFDNR